MPNIATKRSTLLAIMLPSKNFASLVLFSVMPGWISLEKFRLESTFLELRIPTFIFLQSSEYNANVPPASNQMLYNLRTEKKKKGKGNLMEDYWLFRFSMIASHAHLIGKIMQLQVIIRLESFHYSPMSIHCTKRPTNNRRNMLFRELERQLRSLQIISKLSLN